MSSDKERMEDLRKKLDVYEFAKRLVAAHLVNSSQPGGPVDALVPLVRERDQAFFGATLHICPDCGCALFEKPGDQTEKRCTCCVATERISVGVLALQIQVQRAKTHSEVDELRRIIRILEGKA